MRDLPDTRPGRAVAFTRTSPAFAAAVAVLLATPAGAGLPAAPVEQWRWEGLVRSPGHPIPDATPVVAQLTDDDGDGDVDELDIPDVAFLHYARGDRFDARLTVVDGLTGEPWFTVDTPTFGAPHVLQGAGMLAAGDVDGDGVVELLVTDGELVFVLQEDGSWTGEAVAWPAPLAPEALGHALALADLDQDGTVEVIDHDQVVSLGGPLAWTGGLAGGGLFTSYGHAVDLEPTRAGLELLVGNALFGADGALLWQRTDLLEGATAPADFDGDGTPEIAHLSELFPPRLRLLDADGSSLAPAVDLDSQAATVLAADVDGDGRAEALVFLAGSVEAFSWNGAELVRLWATPLSESCCGGAALFDFDGDGLPEIVYRADVSWYVLDPANGAVLDAVPLYSVTGIEGPVIADVDGDCVAEVIVPAWATGDFGPEIDSIVCYEVPGSETPRAIWNQSTYHVTNIEDDGTVPILETRDWTRDAWYSQGPGSCCRPEVLQPLEGATICLGETVTLDASGLGFATCPGAVLHEWNDGTSVAGTGPTLTVSPEVTTDYEVIVTCADDPECLLVRTARVMVHARPVFSTASATDPSTCNLGLLLAWEPAVFGGGLGGSYNVYKSTGAGASCADARSRPPVVAGLTSLTWFDRAGSPGESSVYVVEAEDASTPTTCEPTGPAGGAATVVCTAPVVDEGEYFMPDVVGAVLRVSHSGQQVTLTWPDTRPLLVAEHFHLLRARDLPTGLFEHVNGEGDIALAHSETDVTSPRQFFDLRVANGCEVLSIDEFPPTR